MYNDIIILGMWYTYDKHSIKFLKLFTPDHRSFDHRSLKILRS